MSRIRYFFLFAAIAFALVAGAPARAQFVDQKTWGGVSGGSANAQTITIPNWTNNLPGVSLRFLPGFANTGATQINISGLGLINLLKRSLSGGLVALSGGELSTTQVAEILYDGTQLELLTIAAGKPPTFQILLSGTSATYTTPTNPRPLYIIVSQCGGGGGGGGGNANNGANGVASGFESWGANPGLGGATNGGGGGSGGGGGGAGTGTQIARFVGQSGGSPIGTSGIGISLAGGGGNSSFWSGGGNTVDGSGGVAGIANSGGGGSGGSISFTAGGGGGAGECVKFMIPNPAATYTYTVGGGGNGGAAGGSAGGNGAAGRIEVGEYYN